MLCTQDLRRRVDELARHQTIPLFDCCILYAVIDQIDGHNEQTAGHMLLAETCATREQRWLLLCLQAAFRGDANAIAWIQLKEINSLSPQSQELLRPLLEYLEPQ